MSMFVIRYRCGQLLQPTQPRMPVDVTTRPRAAAAVSYQARAAYFVHNVASADSRRAVLTARAAAAGTVTGL